MFRVHPKICGRRKSEDPQSANRPAVSRADVCSPPWPRPRAAAQHVSTKRAPDDRIRPPPRRTRPKRVDAPNKPKRVPRGRGIDLIPQVPCTVPFTSPAHTTRTRIFKAEKTTPFPRGENQRHTAPPTHHPSVRPSPTTTSQQQHRARNATQRSCRAEEVS